MNDNSPPVEGSERIPPPGTMAYAQWKRRQELSGQRPETQEAGKPARQQTGQAPGQQAVPPVGQQTRQRAARPAKRPVGGPVATAESVLTKRLKPLADEAPTRKATFLVTPDEAEILEELKLQLRRRYQLKATKNDIVRAAIRLVGRDFA